jgi:hypothetical protein
VKTLETKIELALNPKLQVAVADSECWERKYHGMLDRIYGPVNSSQNCSWKSVKIGATPTKQSTTTMQSTAPQAGQW